MNRAILWIRRYGTRTTYYGKAKETNSIMTFCGCDCSSAHTFEMVDFFKNGLIIMTQARMMGPMFTTCTVQLFTGNASNRAAPTLQFFGISHFKMAELKPLQSAITVRPLICVSGSLNSTSIQMSSMIDASVKPVVVPMLPVRKPKREFVRFKTDSMQSFDRCNLPNFATNMRRPCLSRLSSTMRECNASKSVYSVKFRDAYTEGWLCYENKFVFYFHSWYKWWKKCRRSIHLQFIIVDNGFIGGLDAPVTKSQEFREKIVIRLEVNV